MIRRALIIGLAIACTAGIAFAQKGSPAAGGPNISAPPRYATISLTAGFLPDPNEIHVEAGGELDAAAANIGSECVGWIDAARPDVMVTYTAGRFPLYLSATSRADTTIVVRDPAGNWHCNDDLVGLDPGVVIPQPGSGEYRIWVGTLESGAAQQAILRISEVPPQR